MSTTHALARVDGAATHAERPVGITGAVLRKEMLAVVRDGRLITLALAALVLLAGFFAHAVHEHQRLQLERQAVGNTVQQQWNQQGVKNPHSAAHFGLYVFAPDTALAAMDPGLRPFTGQALWLEPHKRNLPRFASAADDGAAKRFGPASAAFLLYALLPLLVIALAYNSITQEREQGTLRMLHCLGLSPRRLIGAKFLGLMLAFGAVFLPATVMAVAVLGGNVGLSTDEFWRVAATSLSYLVYFGVFAAVGMAASAWFKRSRLALFALMGFWLLSVLVAPRVGAALAERLVSLPSATAFWAAIRSDIDQGLDGDGNAAARAAGFETTTLARYGVARVEDLPVGYVSLRRAFNDAYSMKVHDLHFERLRTRLARQGDVLRAAAVLGPTLAMRGLSMSLAGTDLAHQHAFDDSAEAHRRYFIALTEQWDRSRSRGQVRSGRADSLDYRSVQPFAYQPPGALFALRAALPDALILLAWAAVAGVLLLCAARGLKP